MITVDNTLQNTPFLGKIKLFNMVIMYFQGTLWLFKKHILKHQYTVYNERCIYSLKAYGNSSKSEDAFSVIILHLHNNM